MASNRDVAPHSVQFKPAELLTGLFCTLMDSQAQNLYFVGISY